MEDTMTRIDHTTCVHPRTSAGRRLCRAAVSQGTTLNMTPALSAKIDRDVMAFSNAFNNAASGIKMMALARELG
jgi:hypothetical protein